MANGKAGRPKKRSIEDNIQNMHTTLAASQRDVTNRRNNFFDVEARMTSAQLEALYMTNWTAKKMVNITVDNIFKNGFLFNINSQPELEEAVIEAYEKYDMQEKIKDSLINKYVYGGSFLIPKDIAQDAGKKYDLRQLKGKKIEWLVRDMYYAGVTPNSDILAENYFEPSLINLSGLQIEAKNAVIFKGVKVPLRRRGSYQYIGMSIFEAILQAIINDEYVSKGIVNMVYRGNMKYYGLEGLNDLVDQGKECLALNKIKIIEDYANILSAAVLDKNDTVQFVQQSFASLPEIDSRSIARLAAASNIPATVLLGKSPDGMNATGDGDLEIFYNYIENEQQSIVHEMRQIFNILIHNVTGQEVEFDFEFNKPQNLNIKVQSEIDTRILENMERMERIGMDQETIKDYAVKRGLFTEKEVNDMELITNEMKQLEAEGDIEQEPSTGLGENTLQLKEPSLDSKLKDAWLWIKDRLGV